MSGFRVVAVDFDLRRPALHDRLGGKMSPGLADAILGTAGHKTLYQETTEPGVSLVAAGVLPPERASSAVVGIEQVSELYDRLRKAGDYVIVDTGPLMIGADSTVVASAVDGLLMVVDATSVDRERLAAAAEQLRGARAPSSGSCSTAPSRCFRARTTATTTRRRRTSPGAARGAARSIPRRATTRRRRPRRPPSSSRPRAGASLQMVKSGPAERPRAVTVGVAGLGYWGTNLARNLDASPHADLRWCCDPRPGRARAPA